MEYESKQVKLMEELSSLVRKLNIADQMPLEMEQGEKLYPSEIHTVALIGDHPGRNLTELAETMGVTKGAVSHMVKRLEQKRLIARRQLPDNKKDTFFSLTEKGRAVYEFHRDYHKKIDKIGLDLFAAMSDEELSGVKRVIEAFSTVLDGRLENLSRRI